MINKKRHVIFIISILKPNNELMNDKVNDSIGVYLTEKETAVLDYLRRNPGYTVTELSFLMNVSRKTVAGYLKSLKQKNLIERIGSSKKGYWKVKGWR